MKIEMITHTFTYPHSLTYSLSPILTRTHLHSPSHSVILTLTLIDSLTLILTLTLTLTHSPILTLTLTHTYPPLVSLIFT